MELAEFSKLKRTPVYLANALEARKKSPNNQKTPNNPQIRIAFILPKIPEQAFLLVCIF